MEPLCRFVCKAQKEITARCCVCEFLRGNIGMLWGIGPGIYASWLIVMGWDLRLRQIQDIPRLLRSGIVTFDDDVEVGTWSRKLR